MNEMMAVLGFSAQDLQANQRGIITDSQHRRILAREKLKKWMGFALALVFFCLGGMTLGWVFYGIEVQTKHGEIAPVWFLSSVGSAALLCVWADWRWVKFLATDPDCFVPACPTDSILPHPAGISCLWFHAGKSYRQLRSMLKR